jgi:hypothetical protein
VLTVCRILLYLVLYKTGNLGPGYSAKCSSWGCCRTLTSVHEPIRVYEKNKLHQDSLASIHWPQRRGFKGFGGFVNQANWSSPKTLFLLKTGTLRCFFLRGLTTSKLMDLTSCAVPFYNMLWYDTWNILASRLCSRSYSANMRSKCWYSGSWSAIICEETLQATSYATPHAKHLQPN